MAPMASPGPLLPPEGDTWVGLTGAPLPVGQAADWAVRPDCGGLVLFSGTARDHAEGRPGVTSLTYEAYEAHAGPRLQAVADEARVRWPAVGRIVLLHRTGELAVGESAVVVVVSAPHRAEAFDAARWCIDTLKRTVPIWKREVWDGGASWGLDAQHIVDADDPAAAAAPADAARAAAGAPAASVRQGASR
jgi:molybdopterin synthase catalytic subunit